MHELYSHPAAGARLVETVRCSLVRIRRDLLELTYEVDAAAGELVMPKGNKSRRNGLWKTTCFEVFIGKSEDPAYREFNFAPGGDWAAYGFSGYRAEQHDLAMPAVPLIELFLEPGKVTVRVRVSIDDLADGDPVAICAVIEEVDFGLSYWSIHNGMPAPDFHHPSCFTATLPAPGQP